MTIRLSVIGEVEVIIVKLLVIDPKATQESSFLHLIIVISLSVIVFLLLGLMVFIGIICETSVLAGRIYGQKLFRPVQNIKLIRQNLRNHKQVIVILDIVLNLVESIPLINPCYYKQLLLPIQRVLHLKLDRMELSSG